MISSICYTIYIISVPQNLKHTHVSRSAVNGNRSQTPRLFRRLVVCMTEDEVIGLLEIAG